MRLRSRFTPLRSLLPSLTGSNSRAAAFAVKRTQIPCALPGNRLWYWHRLARLEPGPAKIEASCGTRSAPTFSMTFLDLSLNADSSPLAPGEHRTLTVDVRGTLAKVPLEARNLSPRVAELSGGNPAKTSSSGGAENAARFELIGRERGNFLISVRLLPTPIPLPR